jgi:hypothetical protein
MADLGEHLLELSGGRPPEELAKRDLRNGTEGVNPESIHQPLRPPRDLVRDGIGARFDPDFASFELPIIED